MKFSETVWCSLIYMVPGVRKAIGGRDKYLDQDSQVASCLSVVSKRMLTVFSWTMIHDIFPLTKRKDTVSCFQALAIVSLAPSKINMIRR